MYQCMHCGAFAVIWDNDFDFEDYGYEGVGVVQEYHCTECGAEITCKVKTDEDDRK